MAVLVQNIANNAKEQSIGMSQMNDAVTSIEQTVQQSAALVEESASLAEYLGDVAQQLDGLVGKFQLGDCRSAVIDAVSKNSLGSILVVDDNVPNQKVASALLRKLGYHTDTADNGKHALDKLASGQYTAVLMDLDMPVMDGCTATGHIRRGDQGINKNLPILALTGHTKAHKQKAMDAGMNDFMTKPINPAELEQKISKLTGKQSTYQTPASSQTSKKAIPLLPERDAKKSASSEWSEF
jgi:methyl-accepting chemotaxis protein